ncbi:hypothetical protein GCM10010435_66950 [Winogradskya consettensis]|uniref:Serine/threonine protein phosphatase n=1 Tax=Winogradskya consettensis TaxID=113560 RepID=A0A919VS74_9ACTN|nr:hypothetical protein [Actinoplanes consettensis]GIM73917.1 hypothetical protein Aco04nite_37810 [Actinoplanes consettensis]
MANPRRLLHHRMSISLAGRSDDELTASLRAAPAGSVGVGGGSSVVTIDGTPVFAKRIPITGRELAHPHSTANLFNLPVHCQYGTYRLAGPGFNAWRELAACTIVSDGVLAGETEAFPLLYHWRVLPGRPPLAPEHHDIDAVVTQFGGNPAVRTRFEELAAATSSLVLFLEHLPSPVPERLTAPPETVERELFEIVAFLRSRHLLHMDGHFGNMRADADRIYLVDFGLATSSTFDLSPAERDFVTRNLGHDSDYAAMRLVNWLVTTACGVTGSLTARNTYVRRCATGDIPQDVPPAVAAILARHAPAAARMNDFCWRLHDGDIHAQYPAPVTADDVDLAVRLAVEVLRDAPPQGWGGKAGSLDWDCWETAEHLANDLFYYAAQLGPQSPPLDTHVPFALSRDRPDAPATFLSADRAAGPAGLLQVLETCGALLVAMVRTTPPQVRAHHAAGVSDPEGFAALGLQETLVHMHDLTKGLGLAWAPPADLCSRLLARLFPEAPGGADPWLTLLWATGRGSLEGHPRLTTWRSDSTPRFSSTSDRWSAGSAETPA